MNLEVGMFVRTKHRNEVVIRQVKNIYETSEHDHQLIFDKPTKYQYYVEDNNFIAKKNPIELIEIGDYVNEMKVLDIKDGYFSTMQEFGVKGIFGNEDIKTIMTKEEFERRKYVIGDD